jgi:hypothetical protein
VDWDQLQRSWDAQQESYLPASVPSSTWHINALHDAGFDETGLVWRGHADALVVGVHAASAR